MNQEAEEHLKRIVQAFQSGKYSTARWHANELVRSAPEEAEYLVLRADANSMGGDLVAARRDYRMAAAMDPQALYESRALKPEQIRGLVARWDTSPAFGTNLPRIPKPANTHSCWRCGGVNASRVEGYGFICTKCHSEMLSVVAEIRRKRDVTDTADGPLSVTRRTAYSEPARSKQPSHLKSVQEYRSETDELLRRRVRAWRFVGVLMLVILATNVLLGFVFDRPPDYEAPSTPAGTQSSPSASSASTPSAGVTRDFDTPYITAADWAIMSESQKTRWVNLALDAMEQGGALLPSERKTANYYVNALNGVLAGSTSRDTLVAWELTAFTS